MKLKRKWVVLIGVLGEILTIILAVKLNTNITENMKILLSCLIIISINIALYIELN